MDFFALLRFRINQITGPTNRLNDGRRIGFVQLFSQPINVNFDNVCPGFEIQAPYSLSDLSLRNNFSGVSQQAFQNALLARRDWENSPVDRDPILQKVEL